MIAPSADSSRIDTVSPSDGSAGNRRYRDWTKSLIGRTDLTVEDKAHRLIMFLLDGPDTGKSQSDKKWDAWLVLLDAYATREGHARVPIDHIEAGCSLGQFVSARRADHGRKKLSLERVAGLEARPGWIWNVRDHKYNRAIGALDTYVAREGHAKVPKEHIEDGYRLGRFVNQCRIKNNVGKLGAEEVTDLASRHGWEWDTREQSFQKGLSALDAYATREGHARVPGPHVEGDYSLGRFVSKRRVEYRAGRLLPRKANELAARPGWVWEPVEYEYQLAVASLDQYVSREGHARVPGDHVENGIALGEFIVSRRGEYLAGSLSTEKAADLSSRPGWIWGSLQFEFEKALAALDEFIAREGHALVPQGHLESGYRLGRFVAYRRKLYNAGRLPADMVVSLESRPGWAWSAIYDGYRVGLAALDVYAAREGHSLVPDGHVENGFNLGRFVKNRRFDYRSGRLSIEKVNELESRQGWAWGLLDDAFRLWLSVLDQYVAREGHASVPGSHIENGFKLGVFVRNRRSEHRSGRLLEEKASELSARRGWVWAVSR